MEKACKGWEILNAKDFRDINPGDRILMGPGPSDVPARTLQAIAAPCIGHLDPYFLAIMNEVQQLLRFLFQTENELTFPSRGQAAPEWKPVLSIWSNRETKRSSASTGFSERAWRISSIASAANWSCRCRMGNSH